jgi:hypothetical protein
VLWLPLAGILTKYGSPARLPHHRLPSSFPTGDTCYDPRIASFLTPSATRIADPMWRVVVSYWFFILYSIYLSQSAGNSRNSFIPAINLS